MIKTYKLNLEANQVKKDKILELIKVYRETAKLVLNEQMKLFYTTSKLNKNHKLNINTKLSARYLQTLQYQVVSMLNSYLSNRQNEFKDIVTNSTLNEKTKTQLYYINKYQKWFSDEVIMQKKKIDNTILKLARAIIKQTFKKNRLPNVKYINMALDSKVVSIMDKDNNKATTFDYWVKLATLDKGKPVLLPVKTNKYYENIQGIRKNFCQINVDNFTNEITVSFIKDTPKRKYQPKSDSISLDLGLSNLFATNKGDLFGKRFIGYLYKLDNKIVALQSRLQKQGIKPNNSVRFRKLILKVKSYLKNEVNRVINRIIKLYKPQKIIIEKLNFQSPKLSKRLNRILSKFGKSIISNKLNQLNEEFNIEIIEVNPAYTSQTCSNCGYVDKKNRKSQATFICEFCGKKQNSDINAAKNIDSRSSWVNGGIYINKRKILDKLVKGFIERYKQVCSCPIIHSNPYFTNRCNDLLFSEVWG